MSNLVGVTRVYADGGVILKNPSPIGGSWAVRFLNDQGDLIAQESGLLLANTQEGIAPLDLSSCIHATHEITNNQTETHALAYALTRLPDGWSGHVYSDSENALNRLFSGWRLQNVLPATLKLMSHRKRMGKIDWTLLGGHPTGEELASGWQTKPNGRTYPVHRENVACDAECNRLTAWYCEITGATKEEVAALISAHKNPLGI